METIKSSLGLTLLHYFVNCPSSWATCSMHVKCSWDMCLWKDWHASQFLSIRRWALWAHRNCVTFLVVSLCLAQCPAQNAFSANLSSVRKPPVCFLSKAGPEHQVWSPREPGSAGITESQNDGQTIPPPPYPLSPAQEKEDLILSVCLEIKESCLSFH